MKKASPSAKKLAQEHGIDIDSLEGTGPGGRIMRGDVLAAAAATVTKEGEKAGAPPDIPVSADLEEDVPVSTTRATIARRLLESKTRIPHYYVDIEVDAAPLSDLRAKLNSDPGNQPADGRSFKLSINDFILKATAEALLRVPGLNVSWMGKSIRLHKAVHLAVAVSIEDGLITPVIRNAHLKGTRQIGVEVRQLAEKAREKKLTTEEITGSTFTVTNLGMFGIRSFYGIINPPNAAILSVGGIERKPVIDPEGNIVAGQRMILGLSGDHRAVDGATGAQFLSTMKEILETPTQLEL